MSDNRISPELFSVASDAPGRTAARRPSFVARVIARLRADKFDHQLAVGVPAPPGSALAVHQARLTVADEGAGLAPEEAVQAFDRFWRGAGGKPGSGLGLAIVRATAERHGGRAFAKGSRFTIELPALEALDRGGTLAIAGIYLSDIPILKYERHLFQERQVRSVTSNTRNDAREFLAFAGQHHIEVTSPEYPLGRADHALSDLSEGRIAGAAVLLV